LKVGDKLELVRDLHGAGNKGDLATDIEIITGDRPQFSYYYDDYRVEMVDKTSFPFHPFNIGKEHLDPNSVWFLFRPVKKKILIIPRRKP